MHLISNKFFEDDSPTVSGLENTLIFFIDNYSEIMERVRVIQAFHKFTSNKQTEAHNELQQLRQNLQGKQLSNEAEKLTVQEKIQYLMKLREEPEIIYYKGKPMDKDLISKMILKYQKQLKTFEKIDQFGRKRISRCLSLGVNTIMFPLRFMLKSTINQTGKGKVLDALSFILEYVEELPELVEDKIIGPMTVNVDDHKPQEVTE